MLDAFLIKVIFMFVGAMGLLFLQVFQKSPEYRRTAIALGLIAMGMIIAIGMIITPLAMIYLGL